MNDSPHVFARHLATEKEMLNFAARLAPLLKGGMTIYLQGPLGAGKTTFVRGILSGFSYHGKVKSPTYALVEPYEISGFSLFHFDLYRVMDAKELVFIGLNEYFSPTSICFIEWPENGSPVLPLPDLNCYIAMMGEGRQLRIEAETSCGKKILEEVERMKKNQHSA